MSRENRTSMDSRISRREFVKLGGSAVALLSCGPAARRAVAARASKARPKNVLLILTDQQHIDTIRAGGCPYVQTPALDRLKRGGVSFTQSYSPNPLCSPARSAIVTGRTSSEAAVHNNGLPIRAELPNLGQWFSERTDYETFYAGKWHLPRTYTSQIPGFKVIHTGIGGFGYLCDTLMSRACEAFLRGRSRSQPFLLVASFLQPHDICEWLRLNMTDPGQLRYSELKNELPPLPVNFEFDMSEPQAVRRLRQSGEPFHTGWSRQHWRYYLWSYYRNIEFVDGEIGRILQALDDSGHTQDTLIVLTADHGEGLAHHQMVRKSSLYDESVKVPLLVSWPGQVPQDRTDTTHLVSGLDIVPTLCDYAGVEPPARMRGRSLRGILESDGAPGSEFIVSEVAGNAGRMVRMQRYKYIAYAGDSVEQLFDMSEDPRETQNLSAESRHVGTVAEHRKLLKEWESRLDVPPEVSHRDAWWYTR